MNEKVKGLLRELGDAINETVTGSDRIEAIMQSIRDSGYEVYLMLEANIAVENRSDSDSSGASPDGDAFTDEDLKFLRQLKIRF